MNIKKYIITITEDYLKYKVPKNKSQASQGLNLSDIFRQEKILRISYLKKN